MDKLRLDLTTLIRKCPHAACEERLKLAQADFHAVSIKTFAAPVAGSAPADEVAHLQRTTLIDLDFVHSGSVPLSTKARDSNAIEKTVDNLVNDVSITHPSASHAVNAPSIAESDDDRPTAFGEGLRLPVWRSLRLLPS